MRKETVQCDMVYSLDDVKIFPPATAWMKGSILLEPEEACAVQGQNKSSPQHHPPSSVSGSCASVHKQNKNGESQLTMMYDTGNGQVALLLSN